MWGEVKGCGEGRPVVNPSTGEKDHHLVYLAEKNIYADFFLFLHFHHLRRGWGSGTENC